MEVQPHIATQDIDHRDAVHERVLDSVPRFQTALPTATSENLGLRVLADLLKRESRLVFVLSVVQIHGYKSPVSRSASTTVLLRWYPSGGSPLGGRLSATCNPRPQSLESRGIQPPA